MANRAEELLAKARQRKEDNMRIYTEAVRSAVTGALSDDNLILANIAANGQLNTGAIEKATEHITARVVANITDAVATFKSTIAKRNIPTRAKDIGVRKYFKAWLCETEETLSGIDYYERETRRPIEELTLEYQEAKVAEYMELNPTLWDTSDAFDWVVDSTLYDK